MDNEIDIVKMYSIGLVVTICFFVALTIGADVFKILYNAGLIESAIMITVIVFGLGVFPLFVGAMILTINDSRKSKG